MGKIGRKEGEERKKEMKERKKETLAYVSTLEYTALHSPYTALTQPLHSLHIYLNDPE